jgi:hypothetical protein
MENEFGSKYVSYDVQKRYHVKPEGPVICPMCNGELTESPIEPSKAMKEHIEGPDYDYGPSLLFVCNQCRWWCVREHYEFVYTGAGMRYGLDYLITSTAKAGKSEEPGSAPVEDAQPWRQALDDLKVYDNMQAFPEQLAAFFRGGRTWEEYSRK